MGSDDAIQFIILIILLLLSGFFSSAETALTTASQIRMRTLEEEEGNKRAKTVLRITENSSKLLSTILIGNNIVNTAAGFFGNNYCLQAGRDRRSLSQVRSLQQC